jgi:outer membrane murein-binding lipoprotein Lpp
MVAVVENTKSYKIIGGRMSKIRMFAATAIVLSLLLAGCTRYANEQELKALDDQQAAVKKAETKLADLKTDRRNLETKLADKQKELKAAEEEKAAVESRLK